jgi:uncharacterized protein YneR
MAKKRKRRITMLVTVSVPADCSAAQARKEVRFLINEQCTYLLDDDQIRVVGLKGAKRPEDRSQ